MFTRCFVASAISSVFPLYRQAQAGHENSSPKIKPPPKPLVVVAVHLSKGSLHKVRESLQASFRSTVLFCCFCTLFHDKRIIVPLPSTPPRLVWPVLARIVDSLSLSHTYIYVTSLSLFCISFYHYIYPSKAERRGWNRRGIAAGGSIVVD